MIDFNGDGKFGFLEYNVLQKDYEKEQIVQEFKNRFKKDINQNLDILLMEILKEFDYNFTKYEMKEIEKEINDYLRYYSATHF